MLNLKNMKENNSSKLVKVTKDSKLQNSSVWETFQMFKKSKSLKSSVMRELEKSKILINEVEEKIGEYERSEFLRADLDQSELRMMKIGLDERKLNLMEVKKLHSWLDLKLECGGNYKIRRINSMSIALKTKLSNEELYNNTLDLYKEIEKPNRKGFMSIEDLHNAPILGELIKSLNTKPLVKGKEKEIKDISMKSYQEHYKWSLNMLNLNLYLIMLNNLVEEGIDIKDNKNDDDLISDYKMLMDRIYNKLDSSIKGKLNKQGISFIQNTYIGFDSEYKNVNEKLNELISVQLAVNTKSFLKIPINSRYYTCKMEALTNKKTGINKVEDFNYGMFEENIRWCIARIRNIKFKDYDTILSILRDNLRDLSLEKDKNLNYFEKEDYLVVGLPRTPVEKYVYLNENGEGFSFSDLLKVSNELGGKYLDDDYFKIRRLLKVLNTKVRETIFSNEPKDEKSLIVTENKPTEVFNGVKRYSRSLIRSLDININRIRNNYVISHLTNADLSMLNDFEKLKERLDIVNKSFVTLGKPVQIDGVNVHIRDTMLLAPAGKKALANIGDLLNVPKVKLNPGEIESLDLLLKNDRPRFLDYAINDSIISLLYANSLEDQLFNSRGLGIPISLSSLSAAYVKDEWEKMGYKGYQINNGYLIADSGVTQTPKGLHITQEVGRKISMYISNYRGGRNESFMYGVDSKTIWNDYDLTSAYTTAMAMLGNPDYSRAKNVTLKELLKMSEKDLIYNYLILNVKFKFPDNVKYPSIPCYLDENTTIYPLEGESVITGMEYLVAKNQGCEFSRIEDIFLIPFESVTQHETKAKVYINKPFRSIIDSLQSRRRMFEKGTLSNLMEKEKGNSIYGNVARGMSNKKKFDIKTGRTIRMEGGVLSNPIIASWITAFIRCVIGECLHNINLLGGLLVSVTTDGFITNIGDLENEIRNKKFRGSKIFLNEFRKIRGELSGEESSLELKHTGKGIISWTTRGQFSLDGNWSAATGLQTKGFNKVDLNSLFLGTMSGEDRIIEFIQSTLRSAKDIYLHGGHVTMTYADRIYRMEYDNKRVLQVPKDLDDTQNLTDVLLDSVPSQDVSISKALRFLGNIHKKRDYNRLTTKSVGSKYKKYLDLAIRNFIKGCISNPTGYNIKPFENYSDLIKFILDYKKGYKISKSSISHLKSRKMVIKGIPKTAETLDFVEYVKVKFPDFDEESFFNFNNEKGFKSVDRPSTQPTLPAQPAQPAQPSDKPIDQPIDKPIDKVIDQPIDKPIDKVIDKPTDKPTV